MKLNNENKNEIGGKKLTSAKEILNTIAQGANPVGVEAAPSSKPTSPMMPPPSAATPPPTSNTQLTQLQTQLNDLLNIQQVYLNEIQNLTTQITQQQEDCEELEASLIQANEEFLTQTNSCMGLSKEIEDIEALLLITPPSSVSGCTSNSEYNNLMANLTELKEEYNKCIRGGNSTNNSYYNTVFITQIYNTNEYEGNIIVYGDDEWDDNDQLINDCD